LLAEQLEKIPLSRFHYLLLLVIGIPYCFVAMDVLLISLVLPLLRAQWVLPGELAGFLAGSSFIGMFIGASGWGYISDFIGRKKSLELTIITFTAFTGLSALAWDWSSMILMRILTGVGLGGCIPICFVYLSEFIPAKNRGSFLVLLDSFWAYGWILATLLGYLVIPPYGWQAFFLTGAIPVVTVLVVHLALPESIRYLEERGKIEEAMFLLKEIGRKSGEEFELKSVKGVKPKVTAKVPIGELWSRQYRRRTFFSWAMWFSMVYGYYSLVLWVISFMTDLGYPLPTAMFNALLTSFAQIPGYFTSAWLIEKIGRKPTLATYLTMTTVSTVGFALSKTSLQLIVSLSAINFFCLGAWGVVMVYCTELYPTRVRGTGYGAASGFGRLAGVIGPTVIGYLMDAYGLFTTLSVTAAVFLIGAVNAVVLGIETKGKTLEEISERKSD